MAEGKNSFVLYTEQKEIFEAVSDEQAGKLIKHIFRYVNDENPTTDDEIVRALFIGIKQALKRDLKKWETKQEQRKEAGRKSAEKRKKAAQLAKQKSDEFQRSLTDANGRQQTSTVNVNGNGNVNGNVNVLSKESEKTRALGFLETNYPARFEQEFLMRYQNKIRDYPKFVKRFNNKVDTEQLEYTDRILFARLDNFADTWIANQNDDIQNNGNSNTPDRY